MPDQKISFFFCNGEGGIRTHAPLRTNGFQDRLVMTTSIPLHISLVVCRSCLAQRQVIFYHRISVVSIHNLYFFYFFCSCSSRFSKIPLNSSYINENRAVFCHKGFRHWQIFRCCKLYIFVRAFVQFYWMVPIFFHNHSIVCNIRTVSL